MDVGTEVRGTDLGFEGSKGRRLYRRIRCGDCGGARWWQVKPIQPEICGDCNKTRSKRFTIPPRRLLEE